MYLKRVRRVWEILGQLDESKKVKDILYEGPSWALQRDLILLYKANLLIYHTGRSKKTDWLERLGSGSLESIIKAFPPKFKEKYNEDQEPAEASIEF